MPSKDNGVNAVSPDTFNIRDWVATVTGAVLVSALTSLALLTNIDFIKLDLALFSKVQKHHIDDILAGIAFVIVVFLIDLHRVRAKRKRQYQLYLGQQRLRVLQATMRTVQDIVNNLLNSLQLFRMEAEGILPEESLREFDALIESAAKNIRALGDVEIVREKPMAAGIGIDYASN